METITANHDIKVLHIMAASFPDGIMDAYKKLCLVSRAGNQDTDY